MNATPSKQRVGWVILSIGALLAVGSFVTERQFGSASLLAQPQDITIRPSNYQSGATLNNPQYAYDNNDSTSSGSTLSRTCTSACMNPSTATATWLGVPDGYIPIRLEAHWELNAAAVLAAGDTALIDGKIEYNLGSGWNTLEEYTFTANSPSCAGDHGITCTDHVATLPLQASQSTGAIQVRATLTVQLPHCSNCTFAFSNDGGTITVYDIRVIAAPPTLSVSPASVERAQTATFTVNGAPGATVSNWSFTPTGIPSISRTVNTGSSSWSGVLVAGGTGSVHLVLNGIGYDLSAAVSVTPRNWAWSPQSPEEVPNGTLLDGNGNPVVLPTPPTNGGPLGYSQVSLSPNYHHAMVNDDGPNEGFWYVTDVSAVQPTYYEYQIDPDLENASSDFFMHQCGNYDPQTRTGFISGSAFLANTQQHEYGSILGHYQQYTAAQNDPNNNLGTVSEEQLGTPGTSEAAFVTATTAALQTARNNIYTAMGSEAACNHLTNYDTSCVYDGEGNYLPYQSCTVELGRMR